MFSNVLLLHFLMRTARPFIVFLSTGRVLEGFFYVFRCCDSHIFRSDADRKKSHECSSEARILHFFINVDSMDINTLLVRFWRAWQMRKSRAVVMMAVETWTLITHVLRDSAVKVYKYDHTLFVCVDLPEPIWPVMNDESYGTRKCCCDFNNFTAHWGKIVNFFIFISIEEAKLRQD